MSKKLTSSHPRSIAATSSSSLSAIEQPTKVSLSSIYIEEHISSSKFPVYLAICSNSQKQMAVKAFPHSSPVYTPENYQREASLMSLKHPNVVEILDCQETYTVNFQNED